VIEVEKYRALCLLALNRPKDAEQSLERLAMTRPLFTLDGADASPKLVALFHDVRKRTLPEASKQSYQRARATFENGDMAEAARQFRDVIAMAEEAAPDNMVMMGDLKMLSAGFLKLAEAALAPNPEVLPRPGAPSVAAPAASTAPATSKKIYEASDTMVKAATAIARPIPKWERPSALNFATFEGLLQVIVAEDGSVADVVMVKPINPAYDRLLVDAAKNWRFHPAILGEENVKYRLTYSILMPAAKR
jgi:outer membrane biosynthesis protein TonB